MKGIALRSRKVILDGIVQCINCCGIDRNALLNKDEFGKCENLIDQILFLYQQLPFLTATDITTITSTSSTTFIKYFMRDFSRTPTQPENAKKYLRQLAKNNEENKLI